MNKINNSKYNDIRELEDVFLVIPAFNEEKTVGFLLKKLISRGFKIILVDDGSSDKTYEIAKSIKDEFPDQIYICQHMINRGVGAATLTGMEDAIIHGAKYIVTFDADGQHEINDIYNVIKPLKEGSVDVVIGSRNFDDMPMSRKFANKIMNFITYLFYGIRVKDSQSGLRAYKSNIIYEFNIHSDGYGALSEFTREIKKNNFRLKEVSITTIYTPETQNKGTNAIVGLKILLKMIRNLLK